MEIEKLNILIREEPLTQINPTEKPKIDPDGVFFTVVNILAMIVVFSYYFSRRRFEGEIRQITRQKLGADVNENCKK